MANDAAGLVAGSSVDWEIADGRVLYPDAVARMDARQAAIREGEERELVWLLEHPPLYTAGTSADPAELLSARFPVYESGRGGRYTYHGPGQRVGYVMINLGERGRDVRCYVHALEGWMIAALSDFGIAARRAEGRIGIWCDDQQGREAKIGAIGVRVRRWVTAHGFAVNIDPDLTNFGGIVPCGISEFPVTSMAALGIDATMADFDAALKRHFDAFLATVGGACGDKT
ncbi:lipoyl(octanoyl) transferase LipB [Novosphingopyxis sp. YJ-S2-01]|uniref:lipoyl(octanoyl) transferase LipB n=1 Tax=Novosphingopyxis sp. YJ-S2-01 TaxID=2794021 RepID=UPI0018DEC52D|nr:lipoyl(octanoyl) transferase LipB [Novosphingopyxis sp. YJ-S2-01]MBH9537043.1 lipoyl(octanoyl) transferase LipB [Novosphingopyxis sp. YJ-S2-01]